VLQLLAMRYEVIHTVPGCELPGVQDHEEMARQGKRLGIFCRKPPVSEFTNRGRTRLAVLAPDLTEQLLHIADKTPGPDDAPGASSEGNPGGGDDAPAAGGATPDADDGDRPSSGDYRRGDAWEGPDDPDRAG
jgi:hypothetical protein